MSENSLVQHFWKDSYDHVLFFKSQAYENNDLNTFGNLKMPHDEFVYYISLLETTFQINFGKIATKQNIFKKCLDLYKVLDFRHPCPNFSNVYFLRLYGRLRLFIILLNMKIEIKNKLFSGNTRNLWVSSTLCMFLISISYFACLYS